MASGAERDESRLVPGGRRWDGGVSAADRARIGTARSATLLLPPSTSPSPAVPPSGAFCYEGGSIADEVLPPHEAFSVVLFRRFSFA